MKLQAELDTTIKLILENKERILAHAQFLRDNKTEAGYRSFKIRFCWDVLRFVLSKADRNVCSLYDEYDCHDSHIETLAITAVKKALPDLNIED